MLVWLHVAVPYEHPAAQGVCADLRGGAAQSGPGARGDSKRRPTRRGRDSATGADILLFRDGLEAQYTFQQQKDMTPLMVVDGYRPNG